MVCFFLIMHPKEISTVQGKSFYISSRLYQNHMTISPDNTIKNNLNHN